MGRHRVHERAFEAASENGIAVMGKKRGDLIGCRPPPRPAVERTHTSVGFEQANMAHAAAARKFFSQQLHEPIAQVFIE